MLRGRSLGYVRDCTGSDMIVGFGDQVNGPKVLVDNPACKVKAIFKYIKKRCSRK